MKEEKEEAKVAYHFLVEEDQGEQIDARKRQEDRGAVDTEK